MAQDDRRKDLSRSYDNAADIVSGIRQDQLDGATPCPDYDVARLIDHIVGAAWRAAQMGSGVTPSGDEFPNIELSDAPGQLRQAGKEAEAAWSDDARLGATVTMPWGETYDGHTLVDMYLAELAGHAWDLAFATGQLERLDPDLATSALAGARSMLKPEYRDAMGKGNPFGAEVDPPADATEWESWPRSWGEARADADPPLAVGRRGRHTIVQEEFFTTVASSVADDWALAQWLPTVTVTLYQ